MTRRRIVSTSAFILGTLLSAIAWSQTTSSLADSIEVLRNGWTEGSVPGNITPAPTAPAAQNPQRKPAKSATSLPQSARDSDTGLPQVDTSSLIPKGLFSRPGSPDSMEHAPSQKMPTPAQRTQSATAKTTANPTQSSRTASQPRAGAAKPNAAAANDFTLPGLSNPTATANRSGSSTPTRSVTAKPSARSDAATGPSTAPAEQIARRSPEMRTPVHFDPDTVRDDLAGTFPSQAKSESDNRYETGDNHAPTVAGKSSSATHEPVVASRSPQRDDSDTEATVSDDTFSSDAPVATISQLAGRTANRDRDNHDTEVVASPTEASDAFRIPTKSQPAAKVNAAPRQSASYRDVQPTTIATDAHESFTDSDTHSNSASSVVATNQAPVITSDIRGPKQIVIGRPASYTLRLQNKSGVAADDMVVSVKIPSWAEVVNTSPSHGNVTQADADTSSGTLQWQISQLPSQGTESLNLEIIPRASRPLELGVTWTFTPVGAKAVVEVQEPKLRMQIAGPDDVLFGKPNVYRLTLSNPGTGVAEHVSISVVPPGGDDRDAAISHAIGDLAAGANKTVEIEMTARDAGKLRVQASATAEGDLHAETTKEVFCRKPELEVDWRGPAMQYAGTPATYFFRVRNPGTAAADDVAVHAVLPAGAEFVSASDGNAIDSSKREVKWRVGSLGPGDDCYMELRCVVRTPGDNQIKVTAATSAGDLSDVKTASTNVVALADLKLDVTDPPGPVPVGEEAIYEVRIENRGTSAAEEVNVVGLFSEGLEPEAIDGGSYNVSDGRVSFRPIHKIPAGQKVQLQIHARAMKTGTHVFRAEVLCRDQEIKLAAEQTTRFYDSQVQHDGGPSAPATARRPERVR
jgi:uncharacterized repeat protein (TIGR01451 family)